MTQLESKSNTSNGIPELVTKVEKVLGEVQVAVSSTEYTNRDLVALTVEVETLREDLGDTLTKAESESHRRGLVVAFVGTTVGAVQITDTHIEQCRINPIIHRFQSNHGLTTKQELFCDISFPTHNHGQLREVGTGLHSGNYIGIGIYSILAMALVGWWVKSRLNSRRQVQQRQVRNKEARETAKIIYNGPTTHGLTRGAVDDLRPSKED